MIINPLNVVRLLLASISSVYLTETPVTEVERELKNTYKNYCSIAFFTIMGWKK